MTTDDDDIPNPGERYELGDVLGYGVFGKVYSAFDSQACKKKVAVKIQRYDSSTKGYVDEEYKVLRDSTNQTNLIDFYGIFRKDNNIWFVMELCAGGPVTDLVRSLLRKGRRMIEEHIYYILKETVKGLIHLHEKNVIHKDVKGSNILLTKDGEVKLCDFGLSYKLNDQDEKLSLREGSPAWMAPELVSANPKKEDAVYDNRVDVWAFGITAIELGEGRAPYEHMNPTRALFQIVANPPPTLQKLSYWSEHYHDFINECLVKYYDYRPYIMEIIEHPFLESVPENNYHLTLEIKSLLSDMVKTDPSERHPEMVVSGRFVKKSFHRKYSCKSRSENAPHIYAIGDTAYQNALHHCMPQQIVFSGETGSGKTTNYLHLLDHLFYLGANPSINSERIKNAVKLIHSLVHASTPTNDYSTRSVFKTIVSYGKTGKLSGASFKVQCLEKWRVSSTDMTQSNFHFLYYIYDGLLSTNSTEAYRLNSDRTYRYLRIEEKSKTGQPKDSISQNIVKYRKLKNYFQELEFSDEQVATIISVAAAILNLGEARFRENDDGLAELDNKEAVKIFSDLLEVDDQKICWALTNYCLVYEGKVIRKRNTVEEARDTRDTLANNLYARLVDYVVAVVNNKLSFGKTIFGEKYTIKMLDYFGFECFKQNSLSQFMVNCLNEQLHYHFLQRIFSWEIMDLRNEEVEYTPISYYSNEDTLNELLGKPEGVLSIIDDASRKGHSGKYIVGKLWALPLPKQKKTPMSCFNMQTHYTGTVCYNATDMPEKNRDFVPPEITETMRNSQNPIISMFFTSKLDRTGNLTVPFENLKKSKYNFSSKRSTARNYSQTRNMRTQASIFRSLSVDLLKELSIGSGSGGTHFVRCIRTDLKRRPQHFEKELIRQQIRALAIVETAKARQQGYPHRITFSEFVRRYKFLAFDFEENVELTKDNCRLLMVRLKMEGWALGKSRIFLKYYHEEYLSRLYETHVKKIIKIQTILRGFIAKCRVTKKVKEQEKELVERVEQNMNRRRSSITEGEAALIIQKVSLLTSHVHFYNLNAFHNIQQITDGIDLKCIDEKATVYNWLSNNIKPVLKLKFRLADIPFYDTSHMYDFLTHFKSYEREDTWNTPYRWRESQVKENTGEMKTLGSAKALMDMNYIRDPDEPIRPLASPFDETEGHTGGLYKDIIRSATPIPIMQNNEGNSEKVDASCQTTEILEIGSTNFKKIEFSRGETDNNFMKTDDEKGNQQVQNINYTKTYKSSFEREDYNMNTKPANKDFDYIKATPVTSKSKSKPSADPVAELRNMARRENSTDDDPPFNFQGMLRKTNFRRDSLKNAFEGVRRFSLTKEKSANNFIINGNYIEDDEVILSKPVTLEILPGLVVDGLEIEL
ncbi:hypothetical protein NQ318_011121 [Aromia moschata]|uniref:Neither inactivation nor afterpotential protein C n=1 Tax=Aromia moschata TaxID=1265417 RepID=A0AAV8YTR5_9CUCU|nr:hypothetical protein NQ318_011121 [Aromia moschata]